MHKSNNDPNSNKNIGEVERTHSDKRIEGN